MSFNKRMALVGSIVAATAIGYATPASAQATRTWVSGVGDDVNPCSRTAPCKTFAGAIPKTAAGGEINCLDPGGYGTLTITKSITIDCTGTFGSTLNSGGINGFVINDSLSGSPGTSDVILRGLAVDGAGSTPGLNGVRFISGRSLVLEDMLIQNQNNGNGISIQPTGAAEIFVRNVTITDSGSGATGGGILVQPTGANGTAKVVLTDVRMRNNANNNLRIDSTGNTGAGITVTVDGSDLSGAAQGIAVAQPAGSATIGVMVANSNISNNTGFGIVTNGSGVTVRVGGTTITGNGTGVAAAGGSSLLSYGTNRLDGNPTVGAANNGAFTGAVIPQK